MTGWRLSSTGLPASFGQGSGEEEFNGSVVIAAAQAADCRKSRRLWRGVDIFITVLLVRSVFRKHRGHRGAQSLLSLDSRDEHLQESISFDFGADFGVGRDFVDALDYIMVSVKNVAFNGATAVGHGFASRELAPGFDIHVHSGRFHQSGIDGYANGEGVVHRRAGKIELGGEGDQIFGDGIDEIIHRAVGLAEFVELLWAEKSFVADVESDHGHGPAGLEDDLGGFGVVVDIGFSGGVHVAPGDRTTHEDDFLYQRNDRRIFFDGQRNIGERADGDESDFVRRDVDQLNDEVGAEARIDFALAGG